MHILSYAAFGGEREVQITQQLKTRLHTMSFCTLITVAALLPFNCFAAAIVPGFNLLIDGRNDDGTYTTGGCNNDSPGGFCDGTAVPIGFSANYYGNTETSVYVNTNGNVSFDFALSAFSPFGLDSIPVPIIAPFFADLDTRNPASGTVSLGYGVFLGHNAFGASWIDVGYFDQNVDKTNAFQLLLVDRVDTGLGNFDIVFNYDRVLFETGDANFGMNGLGGTSAYVGFTAGTGDPGTFVQLDGSGVPGSLIDGGPNALVSHSLNSDVLGRYIFNFRDGDVQTVPEPGTYFLFASGGALVVVCRRFRQIRIRT